VIKGKIERERANIDANLINKHFDLNCMLLNSSVRFQARQRLRGITRMPFVHLAGLSSFTGILSFLTFTHTHKAWKFVYEGVK